MPRHIQRFSEYRSSLTRNRHCGILASRKSTTLSGIAKLGRSTQAVARHMGTTAIRRNTGVRRARDAVTARIVCASANSIRASVLDRALVPVTADACVIGRLAGTVHTLFRSTWILVRINTRHGRAGSALVINTGGNTQAQIDIGAIGRTHAITCCAVRQADRIAA